MEILTFIVGSGGMAITIIIVLLLALIVLWIILPFAVFGLKKRMDVLIAETQRTNKLLESLQHNAVSAQSTPVVPSTLRRGQDPWAPPPNTKE